MIGPQFVSMCAVVKDDLLESTRFVMPVFCDEALSGLTLCVR